MCSASLAQPQPVVPQTKSSGRGGGAGRRGHEGRGAAPLLGGLQTAPSTRPRGAGVGAGRGGGQSARGPSADRRAYTRCTPAAGHKAGRAEAPAASLGASEARAPRPQRPPGGESGRRRPSRPRAPPIGPGRTLPRPLHPASPSRPCLPPPGSPRAALSPGRRSSCCSCRCLAAPPGPRGAGAPGWEAGSAQPVLRGCRVRAHPAIPAGRASG